MRRRRRAYRKARAQKPKASGEAYKQLISRLAQRADQKAVFDYVKIASIAFWDPYLKDDAKARGYLKSNSLVDYRKQAVRLS